MVHSVVSLRLRFMGLASGMVSPYSNIATMKLISLSSNLGDPKTYVKDRQGVDNQFDIRFAKRSRDNAMVTSF